MQILHTHTRARAHTHTHTHTRNFLNIIDLKASFLVDW